LIGFEREEDGLALRFAERLDKGSGGVPHAQSGIRLNAGRSLADSLGSGLAQLLRQQDRSGDTQSELSSVHGHPPLWSSMKCGLRSSIS
jgi:hypothetical protein